MVTLWQIGICPNVLDDYVEFEVHPQVNKVFDHLMAPGEVTWDWIEMYQGQGGRSPIYGALIELGLRWFGLTLFGIRIFPALFGFLVLMFTYYAMNKFYPKPLSLLFTALLGTAPWYLSMIRSGGIAGFTLSLVLLAISSVALLIKKDFKGIWVPILAGISVALMPYGYLIIRPLYLLLILVVIFSIGRVKPRNVILFLICILAITSIQLNNLSSATTLFFQARGESINNAVNQSDLTKTDFNLIREKIISNTKRHVNLLLGLNKLENFWNPNIAFAYWLSDIVFYPRFLVPFFILGFLFCLVGLIRKPSLYYLIPFLFFGLGLIPGTMSLTGEPNMSRCSLLLIPLYFFIAFSLYRIGHFIYKKIPSDSFKGKILFTSVIVVILTGIIGFQIQNYFGYGAERGERGHTSLRAYPLIADYLQKNPDYKVVYQEVAAFNEYSAYVHIRLQGGKQIAEKVKSGNLIFVRNENLTELNDRIKNNEIDLVIALSPDQLVQHIPVMGNYSFEQHDGIAFYYVKK